MGCDGSALLAGILFLRKSLISPILNRFSAYGYGKSSRTIGLKNQSLSLRGLTTAGGGESSRAVVSCPKAEGKTHRLTEFSDIVPLSSIDGYSTLKPSPPSGNALDSVITS
jgi:hypothetical protein